MNRIIVHKRSRYHEHQRHFYATSVDGQPTDYLLGNTWSQTGPYVVGKATHDGIKIVTLPFTKRDDALRWLLLSTEEDRSANEASASR